MLLLIQIVPTIFHQKKHSRLALTSLYKFDFIKLLVTTIFCKNWCFMRSCSKKRSKWMEIHSSFWDAPPFEKNLKPSSLGTLKKNSMLLSLVRRCYHILPIKYSMFENVHANCSIRRINGLLYYLFHSTTTVNSLFIYWHTLWYVWRKNIKHDCPNVSFLVSVSYKTFKLSYFVFNVNRN